jgi:hypothetical protein
LTKINKSAIIIIEREREVQNMKKELEIKRRYEVWFLEALRTVGPEIDERIRVEKWNSIKAEVEAEEIKNF